jgi:hypothetical protein
LTWTGIDQIERNPVECLLRQRQRLFGFGEIVQAAEKFEIGIVERLQPERDAVHPGGMVIGETGGIGAGRIGFQRDLDVVRPRPQPFGLFKNFSGRRPIHQAWRAAAEKNRLYHRAFVALQRGDMGHFGEDCVAPAGFVDGRTNVGIEIAIRAFGRAERPVNVEAEAGHASTAAANFLKAFARWLMECFSWGSISPNVSVMPSATKIGS